MALDFIQSTAYGFPVGVPAEGVFEPVINVAAKIEAGV